MKRFLVLIVFLAGSVLAQVRVETQPLTDAKARETIEARHMFPPPPAGLPLVGYRLNVPVRARIRVEKWLDGKMTEGSSIGSKGVWSYVWG